MFQGQTRLIQLSFQTEICFKVYKYIENVEIIQDKHKSLKFTI